MMPGAGKPLPVGIVWLLLVGASIAGFILAEGIAPAPVAIILAALKIHMVFGQYMEVRWRHHPLRLLLTLWLGVVMIILLAGYWSA